MIDRGRLTDRETDRITDRQTDKSSNRGRWQKNIERPVKHFTRIGELVTDSLWSIWTLPRQNIRDNYRVITFY